MAEITAALVKTLREQTSAGMMECKKALEEANGDLKRAAAILREKGAAKAVKRAGRTAKEGRIAVRVSDDGRTAAMVEVNTETDFAARNERFAELVEIVRDSALECGCCADLDCLLNMKPVRGDGATVQDLVTNAIAIIGENMAVRRCVCMRVPWDKAGLVRGYLHPPGKVGVLIELSCENEAVSKAGASRELAHNLCLQIAFSNPAGVTPDSIPADVIEAEKSIYRNQALKEGKPEKILDKIVEGRLKSFYKESCLLEQAYVKDEKQSVSQLIAQTSKAAGGKIEIVRFARYQLGETSGEEGAE